MERALEKVNTFLFRSVKNFSVSVVTIASTGICCSGLKWHLTVETIHLDLEEPQQRQRGPIARLPWRPSSTPVLAVSGTVRAVSSASWRLSIAPTPAAMLERGHRGERS